MRSLESAASIVLCAFNSNRKIELFQGKMLIESSVLRTILEIFFFFAETIDLYLPETQNQLTVGCNLIALRRDS